MSETPATSGTWTNPDAYEAFMGRWSRPAAEAVLSRLHLPLGLSWLDVGCGTGATIKVILSTMDPVDVLGVDPSESFIAMANDQVRDPRARFAIGSAESLPAPDNRYDVVMSGLVLHFVQDATTSMAEMKRAARSGGVLASYIWDIENEEQFTRPFWRAAKALDPAAEASDRRLRDAISGRDPLLKLFEQAHLEHVTVQEVIFEALFRDLDDYWQPCILNGTSPVQKYAHSLSPERQDAVRERLRTILPVAGDGSIPLKGCLWVATGVKPASAHGSR
jgi:trans-aconitate methyltransferase